MLKCMAVSGVCNGHIFAISYENASCILMCRARCGTHRECVYNFGQRGKVATRLLSNGINNPALFTRISMAIF